MRSDRRPNRACWSAHGPSREDGGNLRASDQALMPADSGLRPVHIVWTKSGAGLPHADQSASALFCPAHRFWREVEDDSLQTSLGIEIGQRLVARKARITSVIINPTLTVR